MTGKVGFSLFIILFLTCACGGKRVTVISLLTEMSSREMLAYFPEKNYRLLQSSSYNRASVSMEEEGWYANMDMSHFIRVEEVSGRREFVMLDADGPGAVVRWWMTFYKAQDGIIRIYLDHSDVPLIQGSPDQLLSGNILCGPPMAVSLQAGAPLGEEGRDYDHNLYLPIPFSEHCKITYECDSLRLLYDYEGTPVPEGYYWPDVFYNICWRSYSEGTRVESLSMEELEKAGNVIEKTGAMLTGQTTKPDETRYCEKLILPGDSLSINIPAEYSAVKKLEVELEAGNIPQALRSTVLKATFDGHMTVWTPVGEFFGSGYDPGTHQTWMNRCDENGLMESFWVMPFQDSCDIILINYGKEPVYVKFSAGFSPFKWNSRSMYFGSSWHEYSGIRTRDADGRHFDLNFVNIAGKGLYAGDQVTLFNNTYHWWGEGDEKIFVDGESFPSSFGTGSEDYYGYSFARKESFSHPFLSQPVGEGNTSWGVTVNMRHRSLDAIPFHSSISSNIELWHWADIIMNYALTTYYYVMMPCSVNIAPDKEGVRRPVSVTKDDFTRNLESSGV